MKSIVCALLLSLVSYISKGQEVEQLRETGKTYMRQGDYINAALIFEKAYKADPENLEVGKDLAVNYLILRKNNRALEVIKPFVENGKADDQAFQIAGNIYNALDLRKESENTYKKGIKKFPNSGALYNEYGIMLLSRQDLNAIKIWEKGIENDPQFAGNYYNATKFYAINTNRVWTNIYGECFLLLEPGTNKSPEIKNILLDNYKKLLTDDELLNNPKIKNPFEKAYIQSLSKNKSTIGGGINIETLTMLRTRFLLDWMSTYWKKFPFSLFQIQINMVQDGLFDAYNQWVFGTVQNLAAYQNWIFTHSEEYEAFTNFQKGRVFKFNNGQYYH